jgi:putative membrane protein
MIERSHRMRIARILPLLLAAALCCVVSTQLRAADDESKPKDNDQGKGLADADKQFVMEAAEGGRAEVQLGKLAQKQSENADVKKFGEMMVTDHTAFNKELNKIAKSKGIDTKPTKSGGQHEQMFLHLKTLKGAEFDKAYMSDMIKDHQEDIEKFQQEAQDGSDADVKAYASKTLDTLKKHLEKAKEVGAKVGAEGAA